MRCDIVLAASLGTWFIIFSVGKTPSFVHDRPVTDASQKTPINARTTQNQPSRYAKL